MSLPVVATYARLQAVEAVTPSGQMLANAHVHLFQNNISPDKNTPLSSLVEADFVGYNDVAVGVWGNAYVDPFGVVSVQAPDIQFQPTNGSVGNTIYGWYLTDSAGAILLAAEKFDAPVNLLNENYAVVVNPRFPWGQ